MKRYYDAKAPNYDKEEISFPLTRFIDEIKKFRIRNLLPKDLSARILDVGGGTGKWSIFLAQEGYKKIYLVDISNKMLEEARKKVSKCRVADRISIQQGDARKLHFSTNYFDFVLAEGNLLSVTPEPGKVLEELHRVLKKDKSIYASTNNLHGVLLYSLAEHNLEHCMKLYEKKSMNIGGLDFKLYTVSEIKSLFKKAGYKEIKTMPDIVLVGYMEDEKLKTMIRDKKVFDKAIKFELSLTENESLTPMGGQILITAKAK